MGKETRRESGLNTTAAPPGNNGFSLISNDKLIALYTNLLKCRMVAQRIAALKRPGTANGLYISVRGHEAGTVGVAVDLGSDDAICSPDCGLLTGFTDASPITSVLLPSGVIGMPGKAHLNGAGRNGSSPRKTNPAYLHAALGAALANKTSKNGKITVVFGHEDVMETWNETLQIAGVHGLPIIFLNHNHRLSTQARQNTRRVDTKDAAKPEAGWFPSIAVDRNDVVAVYRVANESISRARQGRGPTLIECQPFRLKGTPEAYGKLNGNGKHAHDPILNMEHYLRGKGLFHAKLKRDIVAEITGELDAAMRLPKKDISHASR
jgi:acetoin:2,6-dichlorophenolindophenol oxidoreductase subunit alpha